ncbi:GNAT family N-acetyltransferase [Psychroserpens sp. SPM9]|uniref:GNAT family N-acetyltransferase n=1 Tax=Psychroserpens sp. SPM9 TaxID=2975598 RepID=UPI0021A94F68|nr:GNAT family N-acetyltransferase [Psychroserpens sp. SPM9]MDG5492655.1 GNAT family N-acetyltransferase [Psychroserpens sp. SPM9]
MTANTHHTLDYRVAIYNQQAYEAWNDFVLHSKNATFLFHRDFMEYHKDRFEDFSLLIYKNDKLCALLPANKVGETLHSHQGLTYGGLLLNANMKFRETILVFKTVLKFLLDQKIQGINFKLLPSIYADQPSDELLYLLFLLKAELTRRDALGVLDLKDSPKRSKDRVEGYKRGVKQQLVVKEVDDFEAFWNEILKVNLQEKHQVDPVHSLEDIRLLKQKFPNSIRQFNVYKDETIVAGTTIFETKHVAHSQYISGNTDKNILGSLDYLHIHLLDNVFQDKKYFDFGISNENNGKNVNKGLQYWKEGFGARIVTQDFYSVNTQNYKLLDDVMR